MSDKPRTTLKHLKTGPIERRFSIAKAGFVASTLLAAQSAGNLFSGKAHRAERQKVILARQAQYLVDEIGKLKGSIVKIGQMMALYGEHFLPDEITAALHTLEDDTTALDWVTIYETLEDELGSTRLAELEIEETPIGAASIGQVHRATIKATGQTICLKIQYPGVAKAVDSDLAAVETLLKMLKIVPITNDFHAWFNEIREMMYREVDYHHEAEKTRLFKTRLQDDPRYIVPEVYEHFCTERVLASSYEPGIDIDGPEIRLFSQKRRNQIGEAALDLCWKEVFVWGEMQTDPNFGNYLIRPRADNTDIDRLILLDFGAVRAFSDETLIPGRQLVKAACLHDEDRLIEALDALQFLRPGTPDSAKQGLAELCYLAIEPFADPTRFPPPEHLLGDDNAYLWEQSNLATRLSMQAGKAATSATWHFSMPPRESMFLIRKIVGAYTFMSVLKAQLRGHAILSPYLN